MFAAGTLVAGKYRVERVLGEGGMGIVLQATHVQLGQRVALKFMHASIAKNAAIAERFLREARAVGSLRSDHVCRVSDVGVVEDGAPYIVMEFLEGRDLANLLAQNGPLPVSSAIDFVLQACIALAEAHAQDIVHRDLKPANLFMTQRLDGTPLIKVLDFGIAKASADQAINLTQTATVMGSPGYMSPEQLRSARDVDDRTDIWSLGVILFELISGRLPFAGETITEMAVRVTNDPTPHLQNVAPAFDAIVSRCLEKDRTRRYADISSLAAALAPFGTPRGRESAAAIAHISRGVPSNASSPTVAAISTTLSGAQGAITPVPQRSSRTWIAGSAVIALAAVSIVIVLLVKKDAPSTDPPTPNPARQEAAAPLPAAPLPAAPLAAAAVPVDAAIVDAPSQARLEDASVDAPPPPPPKKQVPRTKTKSPGLMDSRF